MAEALEKRKREAEEKRGALGRQWTCQIESCAREIDDVSIKNNLNTVLRVKLQFSRIFKIFSMIIIRFSSYVYSKSTLTLD